MFHIEVKQGLTNVRRFNLSREELESSVLAPWRAGQIFEVDEQPFAPERAKLRIVEGPHLGPGEIGLGRGWATAVKKGEDVTERVLAQAHSAGAPSAGSAAVEEFKTDVVWRSAHTVSFREVALMAGERHPGARVSEQLALAERAVWELLHQRRLDLLEPDSEEPVEPERWGPLVLSFATWSADGGAAYRLVPAPPDR